MTHGEEARLRHLHFDTLARAHDLRIALLRKLSKDGRCARCKRRHRPRRGDPERPWWFLEVDHVDGRNWSPRELSRIARVRRYWEEYRAGVRLRALCRRCNAQLGAQARFADW